MFPVEVLTDRREQRLPAVADFGVPVLLQENRQIPRQPRRLHVVVHQVVGGEAKLPRHGVAVVVRVCELVEQRPRLDYVLLRAGRALVVGRRAPDRNPAFPVQLQLIRTPPACSRPFRIRLSRRYAPSHPTASVQGLPPGRCAAPRPPSAVRCGGFRRPIGRTYRRAVPLSVTAASSPIPGAYAQENMSPLFRCLGISSRVHTR